MAPEERSALATLARLRREIGQDRSAMKAHLGEARESLAQLSGGHPDRPWPSHAAVTLHAWYTALETLLERVARDLDEEVPRGDGSHRVLLSQAMTDIPGVRPPVLPQALSTDLLSLLSFRHFFRHAYAVELDTGKLRTELQRLLTVAPQVDAALDAFDGVLVAAERSLTKEP